MVIRFNSKTSANEPLVSSDDLIGQQIRELAVRFANSSQQLLEYLQTLVQTLDGQIQERIGFQGPDDFNRFGSFPLSYAWRSENSFNYSSFASAASITYEAWQIARRISDDANSFDGSKLEPLVQLFKRIGRGSAMPAGSPAYAEIPTLFFPFQAEVVRLEVFLSLKSPKEETPSHESYLSHVAPVSDIGEPDEKVPEVTTGQSRRSQKKTGTVSADDRAKVQAAIDAYRKKYNDADPTIDVIRKQTQLGPGKISKIMEERRAAGEWAVPKRARKDT